MKQYGCSAPARTRLIRNIVIPMLILTSCLTVLSCQKTHENITVEVQKPNFQNVSWWNFKADRVLNPDSTVQRPQNSRNLFAFAPRTPTTPRETKPEPPKPPEQIVARVPEPPPQPQPSRPVALDRYELKGIVLHESGTPRFAVLTDGQKIIVASENDLLPGNVRVSQIEWNSVRLVTQDQRFSRTLKLETSHTS